MNRDEDRTDISDSSSLRALGDLTNTAGKRGISTLGGKFIIGNRIRKSIESFETKALRSNKRICKGSENLFMANENTSSNKNSTKLDNISSSSSMATKDWHINGLPDLKRKQFPPVSTNNEEPKKAKSLSHSLNPGLHFITGTSSSRGVTHGTCVRDSCISSVKAPCHSEKGKNICLTPDGNTGMEERSTIHSASVMQNGADIDAPGQKECLGGGGNSESNTLSQEYNNKSSIEDNSRFCGLSDPMQFNTDGSNHIPNLNCEQRPLNVGLNRCSGKDCLCRLCAKASYIWTDLLYQDAKGRLAEVKKSRRQASILVGKSYIRDVGVGCPANENIPDEFKEFTKLEYDLMTHWRSLFLTTENILVCEGTKLQEDITRFKMIRENCKRDMERFSGASSSNLQMPCDDSDG